MSATLEYTFRNGRFEPAIQVAPAALRRFPIRHGLPIPTSRCVGRDGQREPLYPFAFMTVGDSFDVKISDQKTLKGKAMAPDRVQSRLSVSARYYGKKNGWKFITRKIDAEGVIRVWRVA